MNKVIVFAALAATASTGFAQQEQGRVLSASPIVQQVAIPQQVCGNDYMYGQRRPTGGGALLGAVIGGLAGSAIGGGSGRAAATAIGAMGGSIFGNQVEAGPPGYYPVQRCGTQTSYETRTVGYDVTYEYAGRRYTTRTNYDPGNWIPLSVQPASRDPYGASGYYPQPAPAPNGAYGGYGGYGNDGYYDNGYRQGGYYDNGGYDGNRYPSDQGYYGNGDYPAPGVVMSGSSGTYGNGYNNDYPPPAVTGAVEYRNARGEPYRP